MLSQIYNEAGSMRGLEAEAREMERGVEKQENTRKEKKKQAREHIGGKAEQIWQIGAKGNTGDVFPFLLFPPSVTLII